MRSSQERFAQGFARFCSPAAPAFPCSAKANPIFWPRNLALIQAFNEQIKPMRAILDIILIALDLYVWLLIAAAILSWLIAFNVVNTRNQFVAGVAEFLYKITEAALRPVRSLLPNFGGLDISPIIVILIILLIQRIISYYIYPNVF
jgi:YggT family protein